MYHQYVVGEVNYVTQSVEISHIPVRNEENQALLRKKE